MKAAVPVAAIRQTWKCSRAILEPDMETLRTGGGKA